MKLKITRYISLALLLLWMFVIFSFSSQKAEESSRVSNGIIAGVAKAVISDYDSLSEAEKIEILDKFSFPLRKSAHFFEYFVLGALSFVFFATYKKPGLILKAAVPFVFGVLYSVSDELHQLSVSGRSGAFFDVCIDSAGVFLAVLIGLLIIYKKRGVRVG